ncbi:MAG: anti-sigma factor family protein [Myxococcales bacterium]
MGELGHRMDEVVAYRDGELPPAEAAEFERHLAACTDCRASLRAAEAALSTLDDLLGPPPLDLDEAMAQLRKGAQLARAARRGRRLAWAGVGLALAATLVVALALTLRRAPPPQRPEVAQPQASPPPPHRSPAPAAPERKRPRPPGQLAAPAPDPGPKRPRP